MVRREARRLFDSPTSCAPPLEQLACAISAAPSSAAAHVAILVERGLRIPAGPKAEQYAWKEKGQIDGVEIHGLAQRSVAGTGGKGRGGACAGLPAAFSRVRLREPRRAARRSTADGGRLFPVATAECRRG